MGTVERLNRPLRLEIREVKFGFSIIGQTKNETRITQFSTPDQSDQKRKGTISFFGMAANGIEQFYEFQRRDLSKETMNEILVLQRRSHTGRGCTYGFGRWKNSIGEANRLIPLFAPRVDQTLRNRSLHAGCLVSARDRTKLRFRSLFQSSHQKVKIRLGNLIHARSFFHDLAREREIRSWPVNLCHSLRPCGLPLHSCRTLSTRPCRCGNANSVRSQ